MTRSVRFDDWVWNPNTLELRNGSQVVTLEPRVARLFEYMTAHPDELLSRDRLIDAVWDGRVVSDEAVRRAVFNLRQALAVDGVDIYIRTVHKKGYVATFPKPVVVDQESVDKLTPTPISTPNTQATIVTTTPEVQGTASPSRVAGFSRSLLMRGILGAVVLIAVFVTLLEVSQEREPDAMHSESSPKPPATIAVLPFINLSEAADGQLLTDGLTEELFGTLERNRALRVTARGSAFQFKEQERDVRELGGRLGVRYVLEGDVRGNAEHVLVQARLVDSATGSQLWTESYDRSFTDWFALQQDIAVDVASAMQRILQTDVQPIARHERAVNAEAQLELLRARQLLITQSVDDSEQAIEHLQRALTLDPNYALAYARLADAILIQAESTTGIKTARPIVAPLLEKALAQDPDLGEAYALRSMLTDDAAEAERDLRRGLELNPSYARGYEMLAGLQAASQEQMDLAVDSIDRAIALDPLSPSNFHTKAGLVMWQGNFPEAAALDRRAIELNPKFRAALVQLGAMYAVEGNFADAILYAEQAVALDPRAVPLRDNLIQLYLAIGDIDSARAANTPATVTGRLLMSWAGGSVRHTADMVYSGALGPVRQLSPLIVSQIVLGQAHSDHDFRRASELLAAALSYTGALPPDTRGWNLYAYANLVQLLDASGDVDKAAQLQEQIDERMAAHELLNPRFSLLHDQIRAPLLAHAGHSEEACATLERTYARAPRAYWKLVLANPAFDDMRSQPCFQALLTRFEVYISAERARIDAMRRAGQIPDRSTAKPDQAADAEHWIRVNQE